MFFVYVLQNLNGKLYIGSTENVQKRLSCHNGGKVESTKPHRPYKIIYTEEFETRSDAMARECQIKRSGKLRKMIKDKYGPIV